MIYFIGSIVSVLGGIIMLPVYTHALSPAHYGLLETALRFVNVCMVVGFVGLRQAYVRYYFENPGETYRKTLTSTVVITNFVVALLVMFPVLTVIAFAGKRFGLPDLTIGLSAVLAIWLGFEATFLLGLSHLQVRVQSAKYVVAQGMRLGVLIGANYVLLHYMHLELRGAIFGNLIAAMVGGSAAAFLMLRKSGIQISTPLRRSMLRFGLPYIPAAVLAYVVQNADRYSVIYFDSIAALGLLSLASKIGEMALMVFVAPVESIWTPFAFRIHDDLDGPARIGTLYTRYAAICVLLAVGVSIGAPLAVHLLADSKYEAAADLIPIVALGWVFNILGTLSDIGILIAKKTNLKPWIVGTSAAIAVALQFALTPTFGIVGAATATAVTYIAIFLIVRLVANRYFQMKTRPRDFLAITVAAAAAYFPAHFLTIREPSILGSVVGLVLGTIIYASILHLAKVITVGDIATTLGLRNSQRHGIAA